MVLVDCEHPEHGGAGGGRPDWLADEVALCQAPDAGQPCCERQWGPCVWHWEVWMDAAHR